MMDAVGGLIDKAAGVMGGNNAAGADAPCKFHIGPDIDERTPPDRPISSAPTANGSTQPENVIDNTFIEFVHYGLTHGSETLKFSHPAELVGRGVRFRDALERETVLLDAFIDSAKHAFEAKEAAAGPLGDVMAVADMAFGSGSTGPTADDLTAIQDKTRQAGGKVNKDKAKYTEIHKAGMDLHQARANYAAKVAELAGKALGGSDSSNPLDAVAGAAGAVVTSLPGVGKVLGVIQSVLFLPMDVSLGMFLAVRDEYEEGIERICHARSIESIKSDQMPTYDIWCTQPPPPPPAPVVEEEETAPPPSNWFEEQEQKAKKAIEDAKKKAQDAKDAVDEKVDKVKDFLNPTEPLEPSPGDAHLAEIFALFAGKKNDRRLPDGSIVNRKKYLDVCVEGMNKALANAPGGPSLPGVMVKVLEKMAEWTINFMKEVYIAAARSRLADFSMASLQEMGRRVLINKMIDLLCEKVTWLREPLSVGGMQSFQGVDWSKSKEAAMEELREMLVKVTEKPLSYLLDMAMLNFGDRLGTFIAEARVGKHETMEVLIGRIPELATTLTRDMFFPLWHLLFETLWQKGVAPLNAMAMPIYAYKDKGKEFADDAKNMKDYGIDNKIKETKNKARDAAREQTQKADKAITDAQKAAKAGGMDLALGDGGNQVTDAASGVLGENEELFDPNAGQEEPAGPFPGTERVVPCEGINLEDGEDEKVEEEQPTDATAWPDPPGTEDDNDSEEADAGSESESTNDADVPAGV